MNDKMRFEVVVIGGTPGGIAAALSAARLGHHVALAERLPVIGGMLTNGIGKSDIVTRDAIRGIFREFIGRVFQYYVETYGRDAQQVRQCRDGYYYEPSVAQRIIDEMIAQEPRIVVFRRHRLDDVLTDQNVVKAVRVRNLHTGECVWLEGEVFVDATYEGDLFARAGAAFRMGRESRAQFNEPHAGVIYMDYDTHELLPGSTGEGDDRLPAYTYRLCLTDDPSNRVAIECPEDYDRDVYLGYLEDLRAGRLGSPKTIRDGHGYYPEHFDTLLRALSVTALPNRKYDVNINPRPLAFPFPEENRGYVDGDWETRERIERRHRNLTLGLLYFIQNDESVPSEHRRMAREYGLPRDEFVENGHFPWQLYVREARRLCGLYTLTEHDIAQSKGGRPPVQCDSIACGEFPIDSFPVCKRSDVSDRVLEGYICVFEEATGVYQIPFGIMVPEEVRGLVVPVAASTTHVAYSSIRMEPTWMAMGQAAGVAAHLAICEGQDVRDVSIRQIQRILLRHDQVITYFRDIAPHHGSNHAMQFLGTCGFFAAYEARCDDVLTFREASDWMARVMAFVEPSWIGASMPTRPWDVVAQSATTNNAPMPREVFATWLLVLGELVDLWDRTDIGTAAGEHLASFGLLGPAHQAGSIKRGEACVAFFRLLERIGY